MSLKTLTFLFATKDNTGPVKESQLNSDKGLSESKFIARKLLKCSSVILLPLLILLLAFLFLNIKALFFSLTICAIVYFWIEVAEIFAEAKVLTKKYLINYSLVGIVYLLFSLGLGAKSLYNLIELGFASAAVFCIFKGYNIVMRGLVSKNINLKTGSLIIVLSLSLTTLMFSLNKVVFWAFVVTIMLTYEILFCVARFILEKKSNKIYISDMYGDYDG